MEDFNDASISPKYLGSITSDFVKIADAIKESSYQIRARKFSQYPIFPICKDRIEWSQLLYDKTDLSLLWNYYISFLEEFSQRGLVDQEDEFKAVYKDPDEFCCLFVVDNDFVNFVFVPYPEDGLLDANN
jgi:hypothetical protein